jgi:prepilin-type N-terminal cleavage/methylation domain-containing protein
MRKKLNNKGFTLVELLVVVLILSVVVIISSDMIISLFSASAKIQNKIEVEEDFTFLNVKLDKLIKEADYVTLDSSGTVLTILYPTNSYTLTYNSLEKGLFLNGERLNNTDLGFSYTDAVNDNKSAAFEMLILGSSPQQVRFKFSLGKDVGNVRLKAYQKFEKIITLTKTY